MRMLGRSMADDWHALRAEAVLQRLDSSPLGLTSREAAQRLSRFGPNELVQTARVSPLRILLSQFVDVLVIVLIIAAIISASLGVLQGQNEDLYDAVLIIVIVIMNAILGFVQEYRAERSLEALKSLAAPKAHVLREGGVVAVTSREVVPGDVVVLAAGDRIPADARLLEGASLRVNEASLTGESLPVSKAVEPLPRDSFLGDRKNMAFMGTAVDGGRGKAVIVETGMATQLGKIAGLVQQETKEETPLQRQLDRLGKQIGIAVLLAAGLIFVIGVLRDPGHIELLFLTAVGLSVPAIPEGLPAIVTFSLALGLQAMTRRASEGGPGGDSGEMAAGRGDRVHVRAKEDVDASRGPIRIAGSRGTLPAGGGAATAPRGRARRPAREGRTGTDSRGLFPPHGGGQGKAPPANGPRPQPVPEQGAAARGPPGLGFCRPG